MNFKILEPLGDYPEVLLYRSRANDMRGSQFVTIVAVTEKEDWIEDVLDFRSVKAAKTYISNFTRLDADQWCKTMLISSYE